MHKTTRNHLGDTYVLWAATYSSAATHDGVGRVHDGYVVLDEFAVTVTEQHMVADSQPESGLKLVAVTEEGKKFRYDGGSWSWADEDRTPHVDIVDALEVSDEPHRFGMNTYVNADGSPAVPGSAEFCPYHGNYYLPGAGCRKCALDRISQLGQDGEGPLYYLPCPFCEQMRSGSHEEDQHWHLKWAHAGELAQRGVKQYGRQKFRFRDFSAEEVPVAS